MENSEAKLTFEPAHAGRKTLELYKSSESFLNLTDEYRNVTFVLGPTGAGKSTFLRWLFGENLISIETARNTFIIDNDNSQVNSKRITKTLFPDLVVDYETGNAYYDCPGYTNTPEASYEILNSLFFKKIIDHAHSIKFILFADYDDMASNVNRRRFIFLIKQFLNFVKNIDKYQKSISLVVTRVTTDYTLTKNYDMKVRDAITTNTIADNLNLIKRDLTYQAATTKETPIFFLNANKLLNIFLKKDDEFYPNIMLFKRPITSGSLSKMQMFNDSKQFVKNQINKIIYTSDKKTEDFRFSISEGSKIEFNEFTDLLVADIWVGLSNISRQISYNSNQALANFNIDMNSFAVTNSNYKIAEIESEYFRISFFYNFFQSLRITLESSNEFGNEIKGLIEKVGIPDLLKLPKLFKYCDSLNFFQSLRKEEKPKRPCMDMVEQILPHITLVKSDREKIITQNGFDKLLDTTNHLITKLAIILEKHYVTKMESVKLQLAAKEIRKYYLIIIEIKELLTNPKPGVDQFDAIIKILSNLDIPDEDYNEIVYSLSLCHLKTKFLCSVNSNYASRCSNNSLFLTTLEIAEKKALNLFYWYDYMNSLLDEFSSLKYQTEKDSFTYYRETYPDPTDEKFYKENVLPEFIKNIKQSASYKGFDEKQVDKVHLDKLYDILFYQSTFYYCDTDSDVIEIVSNVFRISELDGLAVESCPETKFSYNIFLTDTLYVDSDYTPEVEIKNITIIAPKWVVLGERTLNLEGAPGIDGTERDRNGCRGGAGTNFFGLAVTVENIDGLKVLTNGGRGGYKAGNKYSQYKNGEQGPSGDFNLINLEKYPQTIVKKKSRPFVDEEKLDTNCLAYSIFFGITRKWCRFGKNLFLIKSVSSEPLNNTSQYDIPSNIFEAIETNYPLTIEPFSTLELDKWMNIFFSKLKENFHSTDTSLEEYLYLENYSKNMLKEEALNLYQYLLEKTLKQYKNEDHYLISCLSSAMLLHIYLLQTRHINVLTFNFDGSTFSNEDGSNEDGSNENGSSESQSNYSTFNPTILHKYQKNYESFIYDRLSENILLILNQREELQKQKTTRLINLRNLYNEFKNTKYKYCNDSQKDKVFIPMPFQNELLLLQFFETFSIVTKTLMFVTNMANCILSVRCILKVPNAYLFHNSSEFLRGDLIEDDVYKKVKKTYFYDLIDPDQRIYNKSIKLAQKINSTISVISQGMTLGNSLSEEVAHWDIPSILTELNFEMQNVPKKNEIVYPVSSMLEKFSESVLNVNYIFKSITIFFDFKDQETSLTSCHESSNFVNPDLKDAMKTLTDDINLKLIAEQSNEESKAILKTFFPFGSIILKNVTNNSVEHVQNMKGMENLYSSNNVINTLKEYEEFSSEPFFVWKNEDYSSEIKKFLNGETAYFYADIYLSNFAKELVKFLWVKLILKTKSELDQTNLNIFFNNFFSIKATHLGSSYYIVKKKTYVLQGKKTELINNGEYLEIPNGGDSLSPYTTWKLQLLPINASMDFEYLRSFDDDIDLVLSGYGSFIRENSKLPLLHLNDSFESLDKRFALSMINKNKLVFENGSRLAIEERSKIFLNDFYPPHASHSSASKPSFFLTEIKNFVLRKIYSYFDFNSEGYEGPFIGPGIMTNEEKIKSEVPKVNYYDLNSTILLTQYVTFSLLKDTNIKYDSEFLSPSAKHQIELNNVAHHVLPLIDQAYFKYSEE